MPIKSRYFAVQLRVSQNLKRFAFAAAIRLKRRFTSDVTPRGHVPHLMAASRHSFIALVSKLSVSIGLDHGLQG